MKLLFILLLSIFAFPTNNFTYKLSYFKDMNNLNFSQIKMQKYTDIKDNHINKSFNFNTFWIKVELQNNSDKNIKKIISINNPKINFINLYDKHNLLIKTGNHKSISSKDIQDIAFAFHLSINANSKKTYYLKIKTTNSFVINFSIDSEEIYFKQSEIKKMFLMFFFGFMISIIIYNAFLFIVLRESIYIYYVLLELTTLFLLLSRSGLGQYLLWVDAPYISEFISNHIGQFEVIFCLLFVKEFLNLKSHLIRVNLIMNGLIILAIITFILNYDSLVLKLFIVGSALFLLFVLFLAMSKKIYGSRILFFAFSIFLLSGSVVVMVDAGLLESNFFTIWSLYIGSMLEAIIFSLASAKKIENLKREKEKALQISHNELNKEVNKKTKQLQQYLKDKDLFIQESNHRIKNNLQLISSFVNIISTKEKNKKSLENYNALNNKIYAISLIHDSLLKKNIDDDINVALYINTLIKALQNIGSVDISYEIDIDDIILDINILTNIGLIINELVTNAIKYGFINSNKKDKIISISLEKNDNTYKFIIQDNGVGFDFKVDSLKSFGLKFVKRIAKNQLKSKIIFNNENGSYFEFNFYQQII